MSSDQDSVISDSDRAEVIASATARMQRAMMARGALRTARPRITSRANTVNSSAAGTHAADRDTAPQGGSRGASAPLDTVNVREELRKRAMLGPLWALRARSATRGSQRFGLARGRSTWNEPRALGRVIKSTAHDFGWDSPAAMGSVMARWPVIVGINVAQHCTVETFEDRTLVVRCTSTAWAKQLVLLLPHIERRIAEEVGPGVVDQVIVRGPSVPSWKKGRWSVKGRGVRDTYG